MARRTTKTPRRSAASEAAQAPAPVRAQDPTPPAGRVARSAAKNRSWLFAYIATFVAAIAGPITLTVLWWTDVSWHADTIGYWSLVAQVLPVLLLAIAVERVAFGEERQPAHGSLAAFVFVVVVGSAAIAELLALLLLAFPCTESDDCGSQWPTALTDTATYFTSVALPAALVLLVLSGAIQSGLPFGGGFRSFQRIATWVLAGAVTLPLSSIGVAALATGRLGAAILAFLVTVFLGSKTRVSEQVGNGEEHIELEFFGHAVLDLGEDEDPGSHERIENGGDRQHDEPRQH